MVIKQIQPTQENERILALILADKISTARNLRFPTAEEIINSI